MQCSLSDRCMIRWANMRFRLVDSLTASDRICVKSNKCKVGLEELADSQCDVLRVVACAPQKDPARLPAC